MDMFYVNQVFFFLYHRSAWHLIQPKEYLPTVPCLTHTSTTWRGARRTWIPTCRPARTAPRWTQPELPATALSCWPGEHRWWLMGPAAQAVQSCWRSLAGDLSAAVSWTALLLHGNQLFTIWNQCKNDCSFMFIHLFVCLSVCFKNLEKFQKRSCWPIVLPFHFSNLECCQCKVSNPGTAELWCNLSAAAGAWFGTFEWACVSEFVCDSWSLKSVTFCKQQE